MMAKADYEVGYRNPPKSGQFQKGKSGNPGGERKRHLSLQEEMVRQLDRRVPVPPLNGKKRTMQIRELVATRLAQMALEPNPSALKMILQMEKELISNKVDENEVMRVTKNFDNEPEQYTISKALYDYYQALERGEQPPHPHPRPH